MQDRPLLDAPDFLDALRAGDGGAFVSLVHEATPRLYAVGLSLLRNEQDAAEVVQDTFLAVHRRIGGFRGEAPLMGWMARIATNFALMKLRTRRRKPEAPLELPAEAFDDAGHHAREVPDLRPLAIDRALDEELAARVRAAVDTLPESHRTLLVLADQQELSMKEIAELTGLSVSNVKTRIHRARLAVRAQVAAYVTGQDDAELERG